MDRTDSRSTSGEPHERLVPELGAEGRWPWPFATAEVAGVPLRWRARPEDFRVEELPLAPAEGEGDHLHVRIEKRGMTTDEAVRRLARALGAAPEQAGVAGRKDADAVAVQTVSFERVEAARLAAAEAEGLRVLAAVPARRKLRRGMLAGNRFRLRLREVPAERLPDLRRALSSLERRGLPNAFGPQRFGARGDNAARALALVAGDHAGLLARILGRPRADDLPLARRARELFEAGEPGDALALWPRALRQEACLCALLARGADPARAARAIPRAEGRFLVSALQAWLFNEVLAARIERYDEMLAGDLLVEHAGGRVFVARERDRDRVASGELAPTGPLAGRALRGPEGEAGLLETRALAPWAEALRLLGRPGRWSWPGTRRALCVPLAELTLDEGSDAGGPFLELGFVLPPGSYASVLVLELGKQALRTG